MFIYYITKKSKKMENKVMKTKEQLREDIKTMPMNKVFELAVQTLMQKQYQSRSMSKYFKTEHGRKRHNRQQLRQYYVKRNQYHPELNPNGKIEKKYKRKSESKVSEGPNEGTEESKVSEHKEE